MKPTQENHATSHCDSQVMGRGRILDGSRGDSTIGLLLSLYVIYFIKIVIIII